MVRLYGDECPVLRLYHKLPGRVLQRGGHLVKHSAKLLQGQNPEEIKKDTIIRGTNSKDIKLIFWFPVLSFQKKSEGGQFWVVFFSFHRINFCREDFIFIFCYVLNTKLKLYLQNQF